MKTVQGSISFLVLATLEGILGTVAAVAKKLRAS